MTGLRDRLRKAVYSEPSIDSADSFCERYYEVLEAALANQGSDNFILARDVSGLADPFGLPGGYYWLLDWDDADDKVSVLDPSCDDYYTYRYGRENFDISQDALKLIRCDRNET